jgi:Icc protein
VAAVQALGLELGAIVVTGDLTDHGEAAEYAAGQELMAPLGAPLHVLPGNHDERAAIRRAFDLPGSGADPVGYTATAGPLRLVVLDTTIPGEDEGELGPDRLAWLAAELAAEPEAPTVLARHHPPLATGVPAMDDFALHENDRRELGALLAGHAQVVRVIAGHLHLAIAATIGGRPLVVAPSTFVQTRLDFTAAQMSFAAEPPGFVLHVWRDGTLTSHVQTAG